MTRVAARHFLRRRARRQSDCGSAADAWAGDGRRRLFLQCHRTGIRLLQPAECIADPGEWLDYGDLHLDWVGARPRSTWCPAIARETAAASVTALCCRARTGSTTTSITSRSLPEIRGNGTGGTPDGWRDVDRFRRGQQATATVTSVIYGRIPALQNANPGTYTDSILVTVTY